jgi:hypothetical protein
MEIQGKAKDLFNSLAVAAEETGRISKEERMPKTQPQPSRPAQSPVPPPPKDDFKEGRSVMAASGGFMSPSMDSKYIVERTVPPDGLLGSHLGRFSVEELGKEYGEGTYKILKYEPGRPLPIEYIQKVGASYGRSRIPKVLNSDSCQKTSVMPTKMIERAIITRLTECREVLDSVMSKMKQKTIDPEVIKGEMDFLLPTIRDIGGLLGQLSRNDK